MRRFTASPNITSVPPPQGWDRDVWNEFWRRANKLSRQELIVVWLRSSAGKVSDKSFNQSLRDMQKFTKEELLGIIDEIDPKTAQQVIEQHPRS